jgi:poly-gamma-glutamate synthesis protein (capsule biosynthesis protein)
MYRATAIFFAIFLYILLAPHSISVPQFNSASTGYLGPVVTETKMIFLGDIMLGRYTETLINETGPKYILEHVSSFLKPYEYVIANFEAPITQTHKQTPSGNFQFSVASSSVAAIDSIVTHVSLANNHTGDFGTSSILYTQDVLKSHAIQSFGLPHLVSTTTVATIMHGDTTLYLLGINHVATTHSSTSIETLRSLQQDRALQIVFVHWGDEYELQHSAAQEKFAKQLIDAGADVIIGHHPHVVQDIGWYNGVPIFYSLGNFVFDQYFSADVQTHLGVEMALIDTQIEFRLIPFTSIDSPSSPKLMTVDEKNIFLEALSERSDPVVADSIKHGYLRIDEILASS